MHRLDGPAIEYINGYKEWWVNDKLHRIGGPAREIYNGNKSWWIEGKEYTEEEYNKKISEMNNTKKENPEIDEDGDKFWYNEKGERHRIDGPAVEFVNGTKEWYINGKLHRIDGPAIEYANFTKEWYQNGKRHRLDGPAREIHNGSKYWWIEGKEYFSEEEYNKKILEINSITKKENQEIDKDGNKRWFNEEGELHREDGPAVEFVNGTKEWYINGKLHRIDGPACEYANGEKFWHIEGKEYSEEEFNKKVLEMNKKENPEIDKDGNKRWKNEKGELHREDGPAFEYADGTKYWYINGKYHRLDGPAIENKYGYKRWYIEGIHYSEEEYNKKISEMNNTKKENPEIDEDGDKFWYNEKGERHRIDGPAVESVNGDKYWYIEGKQYSEEEFNKKISEMNNKNPKIDEYGNKQWKNEKGELHREDGPAIEYFNGDKSWYVNGKSHRLDGPAFEDISGNKYWYKNGKRHRINGPAIEYSNGYKYWYIEGKEYTEEEYNKKISEMNNTKKENPEIDEDGDKFWYNEKGERHRIDGPAVESVNGDKEWWFNGKPHREDGPAVEYINGEKYWYINGKLHREDGPACEYPDGDKYWYIEGKEYSEEEYNKKVLEMNKKENQEIDKDGNKIWYNENGQAYENKYWQKEWLIEDKQYDEKTFNKLIGKNNSTKDKILSTLEKSTYRSAGRQLTKGIAKAFTKAAETKGIDNNTILIISKFFETEIGESLIGMLLGTSLPLIPKLNKDQRVIKLAEEFQVESISKVTDVIFDEVMQYILPVVGNALSTIPSRIEEEDELFDDVLTNKQSLTKE